MTLLIVSGAFDLSVVSLLGLCGVFISQLVPTLGIVLTALAALLFGILLGMINGLVVTKLRIPAFIATLGMMNIYLVLAFVWTEGTRVIAVSDPTFDLLGTGTLFGLLPIPFLAMIVTYAVCNRILNRSIYGRCLRAVGSVTGFANSEEEEVHLTNVVPFLVEDELKRLGGIFEKAPNWQPFSIVDGRLITGQNPASSTVAAQALLKTVG
jgi:ribose/xylose/arabinose/galactoside ABC-type transport system permease subunit